jgi:hypothetical protein
LLGACLKGPDAPGAAAVARAVLTLDTSLRVRGLWGAGLLLAAPLAAYIPFTHMSHFIGKYFTYHAVRWDDRTSSAGDAIARKLAEHLTYRPTWAARHIGADGVKTWADVVASLPPEDRA